MVVVWRGVWWWGKQADGLEHFVWSEVSSLTAPASVMHLHTHTKEISSAVADLNFADLLFCRIVDCCLLGNAVTNLLIPSSGQF